MHPITLFITLALTGTPAVLAQKPPLTPPVLVPHNSTITKFTLPDGITPINITNGTYTGFVDLYPSCSAKCADEFFKMQLEILCEGQLDVEKYPDAARSCICQQSWGGLKVAYKKKEVPKFIYDADFMVCAEKACKDNEAEWNKTIEVGWQVRDYCHRSPQVKDLTVSHPATGGLGDPNRDSGSAGMMVGKEAVGTMVAASLVVFFGIL